MRVLKITGPEWFRLAVRSTYDPATMCLVWNGGLSRNGYAPLHVGGEQTSAHRVAWEITNGPIAEGMTVDHLCKNRACINPTHMEIVSQGENARRAQVGGGRGTMKSDLVNFPAVERSAEEMDRMREVRALIGASGLTHTQIVERLRGAGLRTCRPTISHWYRGFTCPRPAALDALRSVLGATQAVAA